MGQYVGYFYFPPKKFKTTSHSAYWACAKRLYGINWSRDFENYTELEKILEKLKGSRTEFFAKDYEKSKILSEILETKCTNLDDYACTKNSKFDFQR